MEPIPKLAVTKKEAARSLSVSERTIERLIKEGRLTQVKLIRQVRIPIKSLEDFINGTG